MRTSKIFWLGLLFVISIFIFVGGLFFIQDISLKKSNYNFTVLFENVQGLNVGDKVDMLGKKIGKVSKTQFMRTKVAVELAINNDFAFSIPVDSKIEVKTEGLIGSKIISITPGLNRKDFILPGAKVDGLREFDFAEITPGIIPLTQDLSAFARQLKATLGEEERDNIHLAIKNFTSLTNHLDTLLYNSKNMISDIEKENFQTILRNIRDISSVLRDNISENLNRLNIILKNVDKVTNNSDEMVKIIQDLSSLSKLVIESSKKVNLILDKIDAGTGTIGKLLNDPTIHNNLNLLIEDIRLLVADVKKNPTKYMKAYWKGKK